MPITAFSVWYVVFCQPCLWSDWVT